MAACLFFNIGVGLLSIFYVCAAKRKSEMKIEKPWDFSDEQTITIGDKKYNVHAAISLSVNLPVKSLSLDDIYIQYPSPCSNDFRDFIAHMKLVIDADLKYPILLNENGAIIDGKHRLAKAVLNGHKTIKTRRFLKDPQACWHWK